MTPTPEQKKSLARIGREIMDMFPDVYGKIWFNFNLKPGRKEVNVNIGNEFSMKIKPNE